MYSSSSEFEKLFFLKVSRIKSISAKLPIIMFVWRSYTESIESSKNTILCLFLLFRLSNQTFISLLFWEFMAFCIVISFVKSGYSITLFCPLYIVAHICKNWDASLFLCLTKIGTRSWNRALTASCYEERARKWHWSKALL